MMIIHNAFYFLEIASSWMEYEKGRYMVEVIGLPPEARWEDVYQFFINCGNVKHLEILRFCFLFL